MIRLSVCRLAAAIILTWGPLGTAGAQETQRLFLSGHGKDDAVPWNFLCTTGAQSGFWTNIPVPSNWELQGFGTLNYKKDGTNPPPESGLYEHDFQIPADWAGQRLFLVFDGVMTDTSAKLNGQAVGETHQGGFYQFKYEVTPFAKFGESNKLEVTVAKHSANNTVNKAERLADYWVFGGIYRPVSLEAVPPQFIDDVAIDAKADGEFKMNVVLDGVTNADTVEAQVYTLDGKKITKPFTTNIYGNEVILQKKVQSPKQWTAETPNLYIVQVRLKQSDQVLHQVEQRFAFRTFEIRDGDGLYVNGQKVVLKGVNRHSFWPDSGRCLSEAVHRLDIQSIKDMNGNAVRMSHYPPDAQFLDLCDELGLYVLDELDSWHNHYDTEVGKKLVMEMVTRDANHPCILFWDNGDEGGWNTNLDRFFGQYDLQQRRVLHPWAAFSGLCTAHYLAYDKAEIAASGTRVYFKSPDKEIADTNDLTKYIYMPTEFAHGLFDGGAGAGFQDYWNMMMNHADCAGGFIWAWTDDGVKRPDTGAIDVAGNQAPDGIVGPYRQREGSFYAIKQIWSPIQVRHVFITNNSATVEIKNNFAFTDAHSCKFEWEFQWLQSPLGRPGMIRKENGKSPKIYPGGSGKMTLRIPRFSSPPDALALRVFDPTGRELWTYVWPLGKKAVVPPGSSIVAHDGNFGGQNTGTVELKTMNVSAHIDQQTGRLTAVERDGGKFSLLNGPRAANTNCLLKNVAWQLREDGWLRCDFTYAASGTNDYVGVVFDYPENLVKSKSWLGNGPYHVWKNRLAGATLGVWTNAYNNTITGYKDWIYPEFKGCFSDVHWLQLQTTEGLVTVVPENIPFVQVLNLEFPPTNLVGQAFARLPQCGLGFLQAIPPIGSKFKRADQCGPQSQPNVAHGEYSGSVSFYFGNLPVDADKKRARN